MDPTASPKACHTLAPISLHWQQWVYEGLICDDALGVIEHRSYGKPVMCCQGMVITGKHDGSPCCRVDLLPLNQYWEWETFTLKLPLHLACCFPKATWKIVTDTWNSHHCIPLTAPLWLSADHFYHPVWLLVIHTSTSRIPLFGRQL